MGFSQVGITKLSELEIDTDKDWNAKAIYSLKELVSGMTKGAILQRGTNVLTNLTPGDIGNQLASGGPGHTITWKAPS